MIRLTRIKEGRHPRRRTGRVIDRMTLVIIPPPHEHPLSRIRLDPPPSGAPNGTRTDTAGRASLNITFTTPADTSS